MTFSRSHAPWVAVQRAFGRLFAQPGRKLRILTGVDENLLSEVPSERARYSALGGVMLGTAVIAGMSMWNALTAVMGGAHAYLVIPVVVWTLFVLNLDRWLVSSSSGTQWRRRAGVLLPRVVVAAFFGIIIAEPLVLQIFHTAIEQHIKDARQNTLDDLRANLVRCNPAPSATTTTPPGCAGYVLSFQDSPTAVSGQLDHLKTQETDLESRVATDTQNLSQLDAQERRECAGDSGNGLTGRRGVGPICLQRRAAVDQYTRDHPIADEQAQLTDVQKQISALEDQSRTQTEGFEKVRATKIDQRIVEQSSHFGPIGLLERLGALDELTRGSSFLLVASWLVRSFFIVIDCLPVLVKFFTGATAYDRLVDERTTSGVRVYARRVRVEESQHLSELDLQQYETEVAATRKRETLDLEKLRHTAQMETELDNDVESLAARIRADARPTVKIPTSRQPTHNGSSI